MTEVPVEWSEKPFENIAEIASGQVDPTQEPYIHYPHIGPENVDSGTGRIRAIQTAGEIGLTSGKYLFDGDALVYSKIRPNLNKVCIPGFTGVCSADMYPLWTKKGIARDYLFQYMLSDDFVRKATAVSARTGLPKINRGDLSRIQILLPPLPEQRKIAQILGAWDEAIATVEQLIAALERRKQGLMQRLLTGQVRFPDFKGEEWVTKKIGELLKEVKRPVEFKENEEYALLSVRRRSQGLFLRERKTSSELEGQTMFRVHEDDFLISKRQIVHGASALTTADYNGFLVSNSYHALTAREAIDIRFFEWLSKTEYLYHLAHVASHGVHVEKLFFVLKTYLQQEVTIPSSIHEQQKIAATLSSVEEVISALVAYKDKLVVQKKGLMQRLLTGQVRVQVNA